MADENFFSRWSRRKSESRQKDPPPQTGVPEALAPAATNAAAPELVAAQPVAEQSKPLPTMEDVAKLTRDSDFSPYIARGVDENVKRSALKKLFSDPQFNVMDGLDVYIDDYNKFEPIPPQMLAALNHAKALLDPLSRLDKPVMPLPDEEAAEAPEADDNEETIHAADSNDVADAESSAAQSSDAAHVANAEQVPEHRDDAEPASDPTKLPQARS